MKKYNVAHYFGDEDMAIELQFNLDELAEYIDLFFIGLEGNSTKNAYSLNIGCCDDGEGTIKDT